MFRALHSEPNGPQQQIELTTGEWKVKEKKYIRPPTGHARRAHIIDAFFSVAIVN